MARDGGSLRIAWPSLPSEHGRPMLWFGSWLTGHTGEEAGWFYSGRGGERGVYAIPAEATGVRIRRWPNEGLEPEYADLLSLNGAEINPESLEFDRRQAYSLLPEEAIA